MISRNVLIFHVFAAHFCGEVSCAHFTDSNPTKTDEKRTCLTQWCGMQWTILNNKLIELPGSEAYNSMPINTEMSSGPGFGGCTTCTFRTSSKTNMDRTSAGSAAGDPSPTWMVRTWSTGKLMRKHGISHGLPSSITWSSEIYSTLKKTQGICSEGSCPILSIGVSPRFLDAPTARCRPDLHRSPRLHRAPGTHCFGHRWL